MKTEATHRRLLMLADLLDTVPKEQFDLSCWAHKPKGKRIGGCGTTACAVGWATTHPGFKKAGLRLKKRERHTAVPEYKGHVSWAAVTAFFGVDLRQAGLLFMSAQYPRGCYTTPAEVAKRIREFVGGNGR